MAVITISRQFGAGGRTLGELISKRLGYRLFDDLIIQEISKHARVSKGAVISMEKTAGSTLSKVISTLISSSYIERLTGDNRGYMDEEVYIQTLQEVMLKLAAEDNVVLVGRGGQYILKEFKGAFHILLVGDMQYRIAFMQKQYNLTEAKAKAAVLKGEKRRVTLYKLFDKANYNDPNLYDLVINTSRMSLKKTLNMVCELVDA